MKNKEIVYQVQDYDTYMTINSLTGEVWVG